jgi:uncharacterized protein YcaQ
MPEPGQMARYLVRLQLRSHGLALEPEMRYLRKQARPPLVGALQELEEEGEITRVLVRLSDGSRVEHYALTRSLEAEPVARDGSYVRILSPFDNLVIQRKRLRRLFDFNYQIECYVPEPKRKWGYFVLPVLWGDRLAARLDAKADRATRVLRILSLHFESPRDRRDLGPALRPELERFARFNGCDRVEGLPRR